MSPQWKPPQIAGQGQCHHSMALSLGRALATGSHVLDPLDLWSPSVWLACRRGSCLLGDVFWDLEDVATWRWAFHVLFSAHCPVTCHLTITVTWACVDTAQAKQARECCSVWLSENVCGARVDPVVSGFPLAELEEAERKALRRSCPNPAFFFLTTC